MAGILDALSRIRAAGEQWRLERRVAPQVEVARRLSQLEQQQAAEQAAQMAPGIARALGALPEARAQRGRTPSVGSGWQDLPPELASTVQLLMDPATRQAGLGMAGGLLDPQARATLANTRQAGDIAAAADARAAAAEGRAAQLFPAQLSAAQTTAERGRLELAATQAAAGAPRWFGPGADIPRGYVPVLGPDGAPQVIPVPGSKDFAAAQAVTDQAVQGIQTVQGFLALLSDTATGGPSGTDLYGPRANELAFRRGNVMSALAALRNLGVLQPGEYEVLKEQLPDPTSWGQNLRGMLAMTPAGLLPGMGGPDYVRQAIEAPYVALLKDLEGRLRMRMQTHWYTTVPVGVLPETAQ